MILLCCVAISVCLYPGAMSEPECKNGDVRLAGGLDEMGGRVEVCDGGVWGSVCNHEFGEEEAAVVCNELGFTECEQFDT